MFSSHLWPLQLVSKSPICPPAQLSLGFAAKLASQIHGLFNDDMYISGSLNPSWEASRVSDVVGNGMPDLISHFRRQSEQTQSSVFGSHMAQRGSS